MKFIELFAGIGGFRLGLERAGHTSVWANEWLWQPRGIYEYNFKDKVDGRDIRTIRPDEIPEHDLLTGGFPCATFSIAGKRTGFSTEDTRGSLFFEICRILRATRTPYFLLENVKGLLNHDNGRTFEVILFSLDELGYDVQWELLNSKNFGVPQNRERIFLIGNLRGKPRPKVFPIGEISFENVCKERQEYSEGQRVQNESGYGRGETHPTIDANYWKGGRTYIEQPIHPTPLNNWNKSNTTLIEQPTVIQWRRDFFREHKSDGLVPTLTANMGTGGHNVPFTVDKNNIRKFTPLEIERIAGLPDNFTKYAIKDNEIIKLGDAQRYERCGRTVTPNVIQSIGEKLWKM